MKKAPHLTPIAAAVALAFIAVPAAAQEAQAQAQQPAAAADDKDKPHLETITVTSERVTGFRARTSQVGAFRDAELLDVPMTINVIPRTLMDAQEAQGLFDALKNTAGVARSQSSGTVADNLSIRGVATENRTSFRLNGGLPVNNLVEMPMEDKERVEVLKGSSALYYGFTSPAGIVNMVTKRAGTTPVTSLAISGNEYGQILGHLDVGRRFGNEPGDEQFGVRVNVAGGEVRNAIDGYKGQRQLVATAWDWRVSENLTFQLDTEDVRRSAVEQAAVGLNAAVNNVITLPSVPDPSKLISGPWALTSGNIVNTQFRGDYYFHPDWAVMAEIGRAETNRERRASSQFCGACSTAPYNVVTGDGILRVSLTKGQSYVNQNLRTELAGRVQTWALDHELMIGWMENQRYQNGPSQQVVNIPQNLYNPRVLNEPLLTANLTLSPQDITDRGVYVFDRIRIGQQWQIQGGVRRTDYTNVSVSGTYAVKTNTPSAGIIWKPWKHTSVYASYIEGLEEGGTAPLSTTNGGQVLAPGKSKQKELGVRSEAYAGMTLTLAYFTIDRASAYTNTSNTFVLDGRTEYKGWEYSAAGEFNPQLSIYLSGMWLDAKQQQAQNTALIGKAPDNTPDQTHSLFAEYRPNWFAGFAVNGGAYYISRRFINNFEQGQIPGYTTFNAGMRYERKLWDRATTWNLVVENVGDKRHWSAAGGGFLAVGLPRTIKGSVRFQF